MVVDLFAGVPVADHERAVEWYGHLLGSAPSFLPNATVVSGRSPRTGTGTSTSAARGTCENGDRKVTYRDPDGNEIGFGGGPARTPAE